MQFYPVADSGGPCMLNSPLPAFDKTAVAENYNNIACVGVRSNPCTDLYIFFTLKLCTDICS